MNENQTQATYRRTFARRIAWGFLTAICVMEFVGAVAAKSQADATQHIGTIAGIIGATVILNLIGWWVRVGE